MIGDSPRRSLASAAARMAMGVGAAALGMLGGIAQGPMRLGRRKPVVRRRRHARYGSRARYTKTWPSQKWKGSAAAKRPARIAAKAAKASRRAARNRKLRSIRIESWAGQMVARHRAGLPVTMTLVQMVEFVYADADRAADLVLKHLGAGYGWTIPGGAALIQLVRL